MESTESPPDPFSPAWRWARVPNVIAGALFLVIPTSIVVGYLLGPQTHMVMRLMPYVVREHLTILDLSLACYLVCFLSAYGTFRACSEDLASVEGRRGDDWGTRAWRVYMGGVLLLYAAFFVGSLQGSFMEKAVVAIPLQCYIFCYAFYLSVRGCISDERKSRATLGLVFPLVAFVMGYLALWPLIEPLSASG
jgi:hypothetical protein